MLLKWLASLASGKTFTKRYSIQIRAHGIERYYSAQTLTQIFGLMLSNFT